MEQLNLHKLVNLRKRFDKYDCEISKEIVSLIDKHLVLEREKSRLKDNERRGDYQSKTLICEICGKTMMRKSIYKHMKTVHSDKDDLLLDVKF